MALYPPYSGLLVYVVGASGSGKDSLIDFAKQHFALAKTPKPYSGIHFVQRYITRPAAAGYEKHASLSPQEFEKLSESGAFVMEWHSHGLSYGIGREILALLEQDGMVIMNGSRRYAKQAKQLIEPLLLVEVTVELEVLRSRLEKRARESQEVIESRLKQAKQRIPAFANQVRIDNSGALETAQQAFVNVLNNTPKYLA